jgi:hypothetical protein
VTADAARPPGDDGTGETEGGVVEIRVHGAIGALSRASFAGFEAVVEPVSTTLRGPVRDEADLRDLVRRVRDSGLDLVSLRVLDGDLADDPPDAPVTPA